MSDEQLVNAILKGDTARFSEVVERHLSAVRGVCYSYERDPGTRDDLVQETFIDAYKNLHKLRNPAKLGAWIVKIARRRGLTWARQQVRHREIHEQFQSQQPRVSDTTPLTDAARNEVREWVLGRVHALPHKTREAVLLFYFEGLTTRECAEALNTSEASVKKRLQYGRQLIGEQITKLLGPAEDRNQEQKTKILASIPLAAAPWLGGMKGTTGRTPVFSRLATPIKIAVAAGIILLAAYVIWSSGSTPPTDASLPPRSVDNQAPAGSDDMNSVTAAMQVPEESAAAVNEVPAATGDLAISVMIQDWETNSDGTRRIILGPPVANASITVTPFKLVVPEPILAILEAEGVDEAELALLVQGLRTFRPGDPSPFGSGLGQRVVEIANDRSRFPNGVSVQEPVESAIVHMVSDDNGAALVRDFPEGLAAIRVDLDRNGDGKLRNLGGTQAYVEANTITRSDVLVLDEISNVRGRVVLSGTEAPPERIRLKLETDEEDSFNRSTMTLEDGTFEFQYAHLPKGTRYTILVDEARYFSEIVEGTLEVGKPVFYRMELFENGSVSGKVAYESGRPVVGARVTRQGGARTNGESAFTDQSGTYTLYHEGGHLVVDASRLSSRSETATFDLRRDESVTQDFVFPDETCITIKLEPDDVESLGENTQLAIQRTKSTMWETVTSQLTHEKDKNTYSFYGPPGDYAFRVYSLGYNPIEFQASLALNATPETRTLRFEPATEKLDVVMYQDNGEPAQIGMVVLKELLPKSDGGTTWGPLNLDATINRDGTATIPNLWPGTYKNLSGRYEPEIITIPHEGVLELRPKVRPPGQPNTQPAEPRYYSTVREDFLMTHHSAPNMPLSLDDADCIAATEQGDLLPCSYVQAEGRHTVYWIKPGYVPGFVTVDFVEGQRRLTNETIRFQIEAGGGAYGTATDDTGNPLPDAEMYVYPEATWNSLFTPEGMKTNRTGHEFAQGVHADENGAFEIPNLPEGMFYIAAVVRRSDERPTVELRTAWYGPVEIRNGHDTGPINLVLPDPVSVTEGPERVSE